MGHAMHRLRPILVGLLLVTTGVLWAQEPVHKGTIRKVDAERGLLWITSNGRDFEFRVGKDVPVMGPDFKPLEAGLADPRIKKGARVMVKMEKRDGRPVLAGIKLDDSPEASQARPPFTRRELASLKALPALATGRYHGFPGGLYPEGQNQRPAAHEKAGLALARQVQALDPDGRPDPHGKIVLLSIGMSNTTQEFEVFQQIANADPAKNRRLVIVDGAQGGMTASRIVNPDDHAGGTQYWSTVDERLHAGHVTRAQVQVAWIKQADANPTQGFPEYAKTLEEQLARIVHILHERFPNLKLVYLSSRIYGGYAKTPLNPEPYAYESGFSVKWLIERQLKGDASLNFDPDKGSVKAPWLSWGPYMWSNPMTRGAGGVSYVPTDFGGDGTHPSRAGQLKVAQQLLRFFKSDSTTRSWFTGRLTSFLEPAPTSQNAGWNRLAVSSPRNLCKTWFLFSST
jgi:hypothetical protein